MNYKENLEKHLEIGINQRVRRNGLLRIDLAAGIGSLEETQAEISANDQWIKEAQDTLGGTDG